MPLPNATLQTRIETMLNNVRTAVTNRQAAYVARRGRYWQGRVSHVQPPPDPDPTLDVLDVPPRAGLPTDRPTDQEEPWGAITTSDGFAWPGFTLPAKMPIRVRIDVYQSPAGHGYTVLAEVQLTGDVWQRRWNVGPELFRARDWHRVTNG